MTSRKKVSRSTSRRPVSAAIRRCVTEALEDRRLFAVGLVSVGLNGAPANGDSGEASVSEDGRYAVFSSFASNLVEGDTNGRSDVFLRDLDAGTTTLISRRAGGGDIGNGDSLQPVISQAGTHVAFVSRAANLLDNDTLNNADVFRYTIGSRALELASARTETGGFPGGSSSEPTISRDGTLVSFTTFAGNMALPSGPAFLVDANGDNDVYVRNMDPVRTQFGIGPNQNRLVSEADGRGTTIDTGDKQSFDSWISEDGRYITFRSDAANLVPNGQDGNAKRDTYLRDLQANTTTLISVNRDGVAGNEDTQSNSVSGNGRFVLFQSRATDIVNNDGNADADIFLRDTVDNTTRLLTVNRNGNASAGGFSEFPAMSQNGDYATFSSYAPDITAGDVNAREDVFIRDLRRGPLSVLSVTPGGQTANGRSYDPFINRNGTAVVFTSSASDMTAGDTNGFEDVFVADVPQPNNSGGAGADTQAPTAAFGQVAAANPSATTIDFTVNLSDNAGLNTVTLGNLNVVWTAAAPSTATESFTAVPIGVVGTGTSAVATYRITLTPPKTAADYVGTFAITVPGGAITDVAGNGIAAGPLAPAGGGTGPTFALTTGDNGGTNPGGGNSTIGDPNGPDLQIVSPGRAPREVIGGRRGSFKWKVRNGGPGLLNHTVSFNVYASVDQTFDAGDTALTTTPVTKFLKRMKVNKAKGLGAKFVYPADMGNGNYFLLVQADTTNAVAESNEGNNSGTSPTTALIRQPFTDLEPTFVGKPSRITAGSEAGVTVVVKNNGNVPFRGAVPITIVLSSDDVVDGSDRVVTTVTPSLGVKNGRTKSVKINVPLPADLAPGTYFVGADVDPANAFAESNEDNNLATSFSFGSI